MLNVGDKVVEVSGNKVEGIILSKFETLTGRIRVVVEDDKENLYIINIKKIRSSKRRKEG